MSVKGPTPGGILLRRLRSRKFWKIAESIGFSKYEINRMIEQGLTVEVIVFADCPFPNIRISDRAEEPREWTVRNLPDAEFFAEEWARRSERLHTEDGADR